VKRGVSLGDRDESPPAGRGRPAVRLQSCFYGRAISRGLDDSRAKLQGNVHRRRALQENVEIRRHRAWRRSRAGFLLKVVRRGPVAVAIEQRAADSAVQDAVERLVMRLRAPFANQIVAFHKAPDAQSPIVCRSATEALVLRRVPFLQAVHGGIVTLRGLESNRLRDPPRAECVKRVRETGNGKRETESCAPPPGALLRPIVLSSRLITRSPDRKSPDSSRGLSI
jgi:hypothetical protein